MKAWIVVSFGCLECYGGYPELSNIVGVFTDKDKAMAAYEESAKTDSGQSQTDIHEVEIDVA